MSSTDVKKELKYVSVEGLNGFLNHSVDLKENGITILHGPNGCGKTTLLDMIMHFYNKKFDCLSRVDFKKFKIVHEILDENNNTKLDELVIEREYFQVNKKPLNEIPNEDHKLFLYFRGDFSKLMGTYNKGKSFIIGVFPNKVLSEEEIYNLNRRLMRHREEEFDAEDYDLFGEVRQPKKYIATLRKSNFNLINSFIETLSFFMVKTQRLIYMPSESEKEMGGRFSNLMIQRYAKDISSKIGNSLAESNEKTDSNNKSFPERLIQNIKNTQSVESEDDIRNKYRETQDKITKILNAGLLFREKNIALPDESLNKDNVKTVLSLYLQDLNEKLSVYDDLLAKIEAFQEIVGSKIRNKEMKIHYEKGFYFNSKYGDKRELNLLELSSGEQHQIVLFYELIFLANSGTYYLIDEPEISLHVDWQRSFLDDIARVEKLRKHKFIIATHSPQIIGSRRSLCVALDGGILES